ncbi:hypothetical protein [Streptosporangium sp. LJ11]|uniref:hypothetical protein n=1 Tax=Streptosporangium sp. LJ11 TaxID=3436927 RepID=UPI003F795378
MRGKAPSVATGVIGLTLLALVSGCVTPSAPSSATATAATTPVAAGTAPPVVLRGGRASFEPPAGWTWKRCRHQPADCVDLNHSSLAEYNAPIMVGISTPIEGMPTDLYLRRKPPGLPEEMRMSWRQTKIDGLPALRFEDLGGTDGSISLYGYTRGGDRVSLNCFLHEHDVRIRQACDHVAATLKIND